MSNTTNDIPFDDGQGAERYRWFGNEHSGQNGDDAVREWCLRNWPGFVNARILDHLEGKVFWVEMERSLFGLLKNEFAEHRVLVETLIEMKRRRKENLSILVWALQMGHPKAVVVKVLQTLNDHLHLYPLTEPPPGDDCDPPIFVDPK